MFRPLTPQEIYKRRYFDAVVMFIGGVLLLAMACGANSGPGQEGIEVARQIEASQLQKFADGKTPLCFTMRTAHDGITAKNGKTYALAVLTFNEMNEHLKRMTQRCQYFPDKIQLSDEGQSIKLSVSTKDIDVSKLTWAATGICKDKTMLDAKLPAANIDWGPAMAYDLQVLPPDSQVTVVAKVEKFSDEGHDGLRLRAIDEHHPCIVTVKPAVELLKEAKTGRESSAAASTPLVILLAVPGLGLLIWSFRTFTMKKPDEAEPEQAKDDSKDSAASEKSEDKNNEKADDDKTGKEQ